MNNRKRIQGNVIPVCLRTMRNLPRHFPWWPRATWVIDFAYKVGMTTSNIAPWTPSFFSSFLNPQQNWWEVDFWKNPGVFCDISVHPIFSSATFLRVVWTIFSCIKAFFWGPLLLLPKGWPEEVHDFHLEIASRGPMSWAFAFSATDWGGANDSWYASIQLGITQCSSSRSKMHLFVALCV